MSAHSTAVGRALVAFSTQQVVEQVISHAVETDPSLRADQLRRALAITRLTGFAVCRREHDLTTSAIAAPVFGVEREVVAALELETHNGRDVHALRAPLMLASQALSRQCRGLGLGTEFRLDAVVPARRAEIRSGAKNGGQP
jgi:DNA-binding IclR family transcriptional regulator